jgi:hypothetical protein
MKKSKLLPVLLAVAVLGASGCTGGAQTETTTMTTAEIGFAREREGDDAFAIDKINVDPLPEGAVYLEKSDVRTYIMAGDWDCDISAANYKDQFHDLDKYAESLMANMVITFMYQTSDVIPEEPIKTTVGGYDAVLYNYTIDEKLWQTDTDGFAVTDAEGSEISYSGRHFTCRAYFFFSDNDAYYILFTTKTENYANAAPQWDQIIANVKIDPDLKLAETTTISAMNSVTTISQ